MKRFLDHEQLKPNTMATCGMSLTELLVGVAVSGIFLTAAVKIFNNFTISRLQMEAKTVTQSDLQTVERWLNSRMEKVTPGGTAYPRGTQVYTYNGAWVACDDSTTDCLGQTNFQFHMIAPDNSSQLQRIIGECIANSATGWPTDVSSRIGGSPANCRQACPTGQHAEIRLEKLDGTFVCQPNGTNCVTSGVWKTQMSFPNNFLVNQEHTADYKPANNGKLVAMSVCIDRLVADNSVTFTLRGEYFLGGLEDRSGRQTEFVESVRTFYLDRAQLNGVTLK